MQFLLDEKVKETELWNVCDHFKLEFLVAKKVAAYKTIKIAFSVIGQKPLVGDDCVEARSKKRQMHHEALILAQRHVSLRDKFVQRLEIGFDAEEVV